MNWYKKAQIEESQNELPEISYNNIDINTEEDNAKNEFLENQEKIFYHGTAVKFDVFELKDVPHKRDMYGEGFYFTDSKELAQQYASRAYISGRGKNPHVKIVSLSIKNPLQIKYLDIHGIVKYYKNLTIYAKEKGYDGIIITDLIEEGYNMGNEYIVFDSSQIQIIENINELV